MVGLRLGLISLCMLALRIGDWFCPIPAKSDRNSVCVLLTVFALLILDAAYSLS